MYYILLLYATIIISIIYFTLSHPFTFLVYIQFVIVCLALQFGGLLHLSGIENYIHGDLDGYYEVKFIIKYIYLYISEAYLSLYNVGDS